MNLYKLKRHKLRFYIKDNFLPRKLTALVMFSVVHVLSLFSDVNGVCFLTELYI